MSHSKPSANLAAFACVGALIVAHRLAPGAGASDAAVFYGTVISGMLALLVAPVLAVQAWHAAETRPSPWRSVAGRIAWALRPRSWMVAWAAIIAAAAVIGTPHLAYEYPPRTCTYVGWNGVVKQPGRDCPWWRWL